MLLAQTIPDLTIEKLQLFLVVVVPGFVALKVYDLFCPPQKRDFGTSLMEVVTYGLFNLLFWSWAIIPLVQVEFAKTHPFWFGLAMLGICGLTPGLLGWGTYKFRTSRYAGRLDHPTRTSWDWFFRNRESCWVVFNLKSGKRFGGFFGGSSFVSTYPQEPDIYVEEAWRLDEYNRFVEMVPASLGMVIRFSDCEWIEFLRDEEKSND